MKSKIFLVSALAALLVSCGESAPADPHAGHDHAAEPGKEAVDSHAGHDHAQGEACAGTDKDAKHDHAAEAGGEHAGHDHAQGEACEGTDKDAGHDHAAEAGGEKSTTIAEAHAGTESEIVLPPAQAVELGVVCRKIEPTTFTAAIHTSGTIEATPGDDAAIVATASGVVSFGGKKMVEGSAIARGSVLLAINSTTMTDDNLSARITDARAALTKADADHTRIEKLYKEQMATAAAMEEARLALVNAQQALESLTRDVSAGSKNVTSSIGGYMTSLAVKDGDYVSQGQTLATVSSSRTVVLKADLPARFFNKVNEINSANFSTPYNGKIYDIAQMGGRKLATARSTTDYSLPVRFEIENRDGLVSGSVVDVFLKTTPVQNVVAVPLTALTEEQGAFYVYIRLDAECYVKRAVQRGQNNGVDVEILNGLKPGETVVTSGAYFVRLASMSTAIPDGHNH